MGLISKLFGKAPVVNYISKVVIGDLSSYHNIIYLSVPEWANYWSIDPDGDIGVWEYPPIYDQLSLGYTAPSGRVEYIGSFKISCSYAVTGELHDV